MAKQEVTLQNFAGGVFSPKMYGRYELPVSNNGCKRMRNFIAETQGPATYRPGLRYVNSTRRNKIANLIDFQFNDEQSYMLEFTEGYLRFYKDGGLILLTDKTITGVTQANPAVVTSASHGYSNGDEVFITEVVGMTELNGKSFIVAGVAANTFQLTDQDGNNVDSTAYTAYSSAGVANKVYEITTPYTEANDLFALKVAQNADTMYITHGYYEPRKLTRTDHTAWTLVRYTRTNDPFLTEKAITGVSQANPGVVTCVAHGFVTDDQIIIEEIVGMTELNSRVYTVVKIDADHFSLKTLAGVAVDTSAYTAWSSAGFASNQNLLPANCTFYESRWWASGISVAPGKFVGSRSPASSTGIPRYDDFTSGTDADHAVSYTVADDEVNDILWMIGTDRLLFIGSFGSESKATGSTAQESITPTSVNVRAVQKLGVSSVNPVNKENIVIYVQKGALTVRSLEFDALSDSFISVDRNLLSEAITDSGIKQMAWRSGRPDLLWMVLNDGRLVGLTFKSREDVSGWHDHDTYGGEDLFLSCASMGRVNGYEQTWFVVEREVDGHTRRYVEYLTDLVTFPVVDDYFTGEGNEDDDKEKYARALAEAQKSHVYVDSALTYDGSDQSVNLTPAAGALTVDTTGVVFTAGGSVFKSTDVGRKIYKKAVDGDGYGRATITGYTSATVVTCTIDQAFDSVTAMDAGNWYLTTDEVTGLDHLEGREVTVVVDGAEHDHETVVDGAISLDYQAGMIHVGLGYTGIVQPMNIEMTGTTGPSQTKPRNIYQVGVRFFQSRGAKFGTDLYRLEALPFTEMPLQVGIALPLFTGVKHIPYSDEWEREPRVYIVQDSPSPCMIQLLALYAEGDND